MAEHIDTDWINGLCHLPMLEGAVTKNILQQQLPKYKALAASFGEVNHDSVDTFTDQVLRFWKGANDAGCAEWRKAARLVCACSPNSAACERAFSLLATLFGPDRDCSFADMVQASVMLRYNKYVEV